VALVLIVDDEASDRIIHRAILERANHEVFFARDGEEALSQYRGKGIQVVITDLQMPKLHGLELITILRDFLPRPGIVAISGTGEDQLDVAHALGAQRTLTKPVDPEELLAAVAAVIPGGD